jgi:hypothetical protein
MIRIPSSLKSQSFGSFKIGLDQEFNEIIDIDSLLLLTTQKQENSSTNNNQSTIWPLIIVINSIGIFINWS